MSEAPDEIMKTELRLPVVYWRELRHRSVDRRVSMNKQIVEAVARYLEEERARSHEAV